MAWSDLASNQMVSFTDSQSGYFTLQPGQSTVVSNQCMTKSDALTKYVLDSSYMEDYASNQLVPKSTWVAGGYPISLSLPRITGLSACIFGQSFPTTVYSSVSSPFLGDQLFVNGSMTVVFEGNDLWYEVSGASVGGYSYQINNSGVVIDTYDCMY